VVVVGLTVVEPLVDVDVNVPGEIATRAAPVAVQLNLLLPPGLMLVGLAVNEPMVFALAAATVTVVVAVFEPTLLVAVSV
jgi:hypothetical protein